MQAKTDFIHTTTSEPHRFRTKEILKEFPDMRKLIGKNPLSFLAILGLVGSQMVLCILLAEQPWWAVIATAYLIGAFADHGLFVLIHECAHRLIFKKPEANRISGILAKDRKAHV